MPQRAGRPCSQPGCPKIIRVGRFCQEHGQQEQQRFDQARGTAAARGYNAGWKRLRRLVLNRSPICQDPFAIHSKNNEVVVANEVDHIIPKRLGGSNKLSNLQSLCKNCHSTKTAKEDGRWD